MPECVGRPAGTSSVPGRGGRAQPASKRASANAAPGKRREDRMRPKPFTPLLIYPLLPDRCDVQTLGRGIVRRCQSQHAVWIGGNGSLQRARERVLAIWLAQDAEERAGGLRVLRAEDQMQ